MYTEAIILVLIPSLAHIILIILSWNKIIKASKYYSDGIIISGTMLTLGVPVIGPLIVLGSLRANEIKDAESGPELYTANRKKDTAWKEMMQKYEEAVAYLEKENAQLKEVIDKMDV